MTVKQKGIIHIDGKEINLYDYFEAQSLNSHSLHAQIEVFSYEHLGSLIKSLLNVCRQALEPNELFDQFATSTDYYNVLEIAMNLIPQSELRLIDIFHTQLSKNEND